jgi:hypothetical protein
MVLGEQHAHRTDSIVQTRCQEKREPPPTLRKPMGLGKTLPSINLPQMNGLPNKKEKPPSNRRTLAAGGIKPWQSFRNPAEGHRSHISTSGVVSVNPKNLHFTKCRGETEKSERTLSFVLITLVIDDTLVINLISRR